MSAATPSENPATCPTRGRVFANTLASPTLGYEMAYRIYLPPCYVRDAPHRYPVLYLIHGLGFTESQWDDLDVDETADDLILAGEVSPFIVVMPRDRTDSRFSAALAADLIPHVDTAFRTLPDREHRAVGGLSRGAGWAVHMGLLREDLFGVIGAHSLAVFRADAGSIGSWLDGLALLPRIYVDIGEDDSLLYSARYFEQSLDQRGIPHEWHLNPGGHNAAYWHAHVEEYLRWYAADW